MDPTLNHPLGDDFDRRWSELLPVIANNKVPFHLRPNISALVSVLAKTNDEDMGRSVDACDPFRPGHQLGMMYSLGSKMIRHKTGSYNWEGVDVLPYKEDSSLFKSITRQTLFRGENDLAVEFRYFEIGPGGHSTLERHVHQHAVMIIRGSGEVFVGDQVTPISLHSLVHIPPMTWHQFRATNGEELGFLCVVAVDRDKPQRPTESDLAAFAQFNGVSEFIRF